MKLSAFKAAAILAFCGSSLAAPTKGTEDLVDAGLYMISGPDPNFDPNGADIAKVIKLDTDAALMRTAHISGTQGFIPEGVVNTLLEEADEAKLDKRVVLGADSRYVQTSTGWPYSAIGRLTATTSSGTSICTGWLAGPRHVVAARHCIPSGGASWRFAPAYDNGERLGGTNVAFVVYYPTGQTGHCNSAYDFAVFVTQDRIGDRVGWLGTAVPGPYSTGRAIFNNYGYPGDRDGTRRPYMSNGITFTQHSMCHSGAPVHHNGDTAGGHSGGPLWTVENNDLRVYSVHVAGVAGSHNVGAGGQVFVDMLYSVLYEHP